MKDKRNPSKKRRYEDYGYVENTGGLTPAKHDNAVHNTHRPLILRS